MMMVLVVAASSSCCMTRSDGQLLMTAKLNKVHSSSATVHSFKQKALFDDVPTLSQTPATVTGSCYHIATLIILDLLYIIIL